MKEEFVMQDIFVQASGGPKWKEGGSGFEVLVKQSRLKFGMLRDCRIVGVASNHEQGGVRERADRLKVPFFYMPPPFSAEQYQDLVKRFPRCWVSCSGWLKLIKGLDPTRTFNIHPGPLSDDPTQHFGGKGMYGHHVHEAVMKAYHEGRVAHSAVCMHFVDELFDHGKLFFKLPVPIEPDDTPDTLGERVNHQEHIWQPVITDLVVHGQIRLTRFGRLIVPEWYKQMPYCPLSAIS
ncbi:MAG: formyltransferase family protein [Candidatus Buchananbacteria bacterium]